MVSFKKPIQKNTIAALDGVRGIACLTVLLFHLNLIAYSDLHLWNFSVGTLLSSIVMTGSSGVTLFFILSGFLLFLPYVKALLFDVQWPSMQQFYVKRMLRILPGYYVALFLLILLYHREYLQLAHLKELGLFVTFLMDATPLTYQKINGPFWTLAVEWQFYMLLPFLALGFRWVVFRISARRRWYGVLACLIGLVVWGLFSRYWGLYFSQHPTESVLVPRSMLNVVLFFTYGTTGKYLEDFAIGMLISFCYVLSRQAAPDHPLSKNIQRIGYWLWGAGILWLLCVSIWHLDNWFYNTLPFLNRFSALYDWLGEISLSLGFGMCILAILLGPINLKHLFEWRPLRWLGLISYSLYIWHLPLLEDFKGHIRPLQGLGWSNYTLYVLLLACAFLLVVPFSYTVYRWIEAPWIQIAGRVGIRRQ